MYRFYSNGKLLITGEYLVLDGALSLAVPTQYGQSLTVEIIDEPKLIWRSVNNEGEVWFEDEFLINEMLKQVQHDNPVTERLLQILLAVKQLNPDFFNSDYGYKVTTKLDFSQLWGLGSSSTLINNIAQWADVDAYQLLEQTFGGSGYDIACAQYNSPITYQLQTTQNKNNKILQSAQNDKSNRFIKKVDFNPKFKNNLYFVHLNKKQNSREGIAQYNTYKNNVALAISEISDITSKIITCNSLEDFEVLITSNEHIISKIIKQESVKKLLFNNYNGAIKSLGAWGGDFILATGNMDSSNYFKSKGYHSIIPYTEMVLK